MHPDLPTGGTITFFHKSFYEFLVTTNRSGFYCATSQTAYHNLADHLLDVHLRYDASYVLDEQGTFLHCHVITYV